MVLIHPFEARDVEIRAIAKDFLIVTKIIVFWNMATRTLVYKHRRFGGYYSLHFVH